MRSRNIKPGFFKNEVLAECSLHARLLFIGLWCMADREGRIEKRPLKIKAEVFPYDNVDINGELTVLQRRGFIKFYRVDEIDYIQVVHFKEHQSPHHTEARSKLPIFTKENEITVNSPLDLREYPPDSLIPDSLIPDSKELVKTISAPVKPSRTTAAKLSDDEWLETIKANPAYEGLDVDRIKGKLEAWCLTKGKKPTRARLLNWLNREERPLKPTKGSVTFIGQSQRGIDRMAALQRNMERLEQDDRQTTTIDGAV